MIRKKNNEYDCTNYRMPPGIFYNLSKENKKEYLKLFSNKPEQIMKHLDKIDGGKKKRVMMMNRWKLKKYDRLFI